MLGKVDHTQLKAFATWEDIQKLCDEGDSVSYRQRMCPLAISRESMTLTETKSISVP